MFDRALTLCLLAGVGQMLDVAAERPPIAIEDGSGSGWRLPPEPTALDVALPPRADGWLELRHPHAALEAGVRRLGAGASQGRLDGPMLQFDDAYFMATRHGVEELVRVDDPSLPISYELSLPPDSTLVAATPQLAQVIDGDGNAWLRVRADRAWDRHGDDVTVELVVDGERLHVLIDPQASAPVLVDPLWEATNVMAFPRTTHTTTLLDDGDVLITGGIGCCGPGGGDPCLGTCTAHDTAEVFDAAAFDGQGAFTVTSGAMGEPRARHTATLLENGRVLITGGTTVSFGQPGSATASTYDPLARTFTPVGNTMAVARQNHTATRLDSGEVYIVGTPDDKQGAADIYDPVADAFTPVPQDPPSSARWARHSAIKVSGGEVLLVGGCALAAEECNALTSATNSMALFNPTTRQLRPLNMNEARIRASLTRIDEQRVLIAGGADVLQPPNYVGQVSAEIYVDDPDDPEYGETTLIEPGMAETRYFHTATLLDNGWILLFGGGGSEQNVDAELYDPSSGPLGAFFATERVVDPRSAHGAVKLGDGSVLMVGGSLSEPTIPVYATAVRFVPQPNGESCNVGGECATGQCVGNVCCNEICSGSCTTCAGGGCGPLPAGQPCSDGSGYVCQGDLDCPQMCRSDEDCSEDFACETMSGTCVTRLICNGDDLVFRDTGTLARSCSPYRCPGGAFDCLASCGSAVDCSEGFRCTKDGICEPLGTTQRFDASCSLRGDGAAPRRGAGWWWLALAVAGLRSGSRRRR